MSPCDTRKCHHAIGLGEDGLKKLVRPNAKFMKRATTSMVLQRTAHFSRFPEPTIVLGIVVGGGGLVG